MFTVTAFGGSSKFWNLAEDNLSIPCLSFPDDIRSLVMGNMGWPDDKVDKAVAICRFTVNEKGEIVDIRVIKGTHPAFDKESIRILSNFLVDSCYEKQKICAI